MSHMIKLIGKAMDSLAKDGIGATALKIIVYPAKKIRRHNVEREIFSHDTLQGRFSSIYSKGYWGSPESKSGNGSTIAYTQGIRSALTNVIERFDIRTIFDAPCGDFNWMQHVVDATGVNYIGADIVPTLIGRNQSVYAAPRIEFRHMDITKDPMPIADLFFCRDCLFHLCEADIFKALENFVSSGIPLIMTSTHDVLPSFRNTDIKSGDFRKIDLHAEPYNLPEPTWVTVDWQQPEPPKMMGLWRRDQVITALSARHADT